MLIRVIYWHFLDATLGHTPSPFELFAPQVHQRLSDIVSRSPIISAALRHCVQIPYLFYGSLVSCLDPYLFGNSPISCSDPRSFNNSLASCLNPLFFWRLSGIVSGFFFSGSPTLCLDPLFFLRLSDIMSGSPIFFTALKHCVRILYLFGGSLTLCPDPLSFWRLSSIVSGSPIVSMALQHCV